MSEVTETVRKIGLFGIGVAVITQEKLEKLGEELVKKENQDEGKKLVKETISTINQKVKDAVEEAKRSQGGYKAATKNDINEIVKKFDKLEKSVTDYIETAKKA